MSEPIIQHKRKLKKIVSKAKYVPKKDTSQVQGRAKKHVRIVNSKKNARVVLRKTLVNRARKTKAKTAIKKVYIALSTKNLAEAKERLRGAQSRIMKLYSKNIIKRNKASRMISRLNAKVKALALG